jgi:hypothetical protein
MTEIMDDKAGKTVVATCIDGVNGNTHLGKARMERGRGEASAQRAGKADLLVSKTRHKASM